MPVVSRTNNRVLPANARAADVASATVDRLAPVQRERYHNAFVVQGYEAILYQRLTCGAACGCQSKTQSVKTRLDEEGNAHPGFLNELLTGGLEFGVGAYGVKPANSPSRDSTESAPFQTLFSIDDRDVGGLYESDSARNGYPTHGPGTPADRYTSDPSADLGSTVVSSGVGPTGPVSDYEFSDVSLGGSDSMHFGITDVACPVCFGTGFIGGFSLFNGWRLALNYQWLSANFGSGLIDYERPVPSVTTRVAEFPITLGRHAIHVDALRVWNFNKVVPATLDIDGVALFSERDLLRYCDGRPHVLRVSFPQDTEFTHVELQCATSSKQPFLDFPKIARSSLQSVFETVQDFSLVVSPIVPVLRPNDYITESVFGKALQVKATNHWNDRRNMVLGWECEVRPVQPQELTNMLPRRRTRVLNQPTVGQRVRDNTNGPRRT